MIISRIGRRLASWMALWQFLRGLDRYGLNFDRAIDERVDSMIQYLRPRDGCVEPLLQKTE